MHLMTPERLASGYILVLPGIDGRSWFNRSIIPGLMAAGLPHACELHDWTWGGWRLLRNLRDSERHAEQARVIAGKIIAYRAEHPATPVFVIGHSAGGGLALLSLRALPADVRVTAGILLAPAVSPGFDLAAPLRHTERGIWNFSSWGDLLILGALTTCCGTVDGPHGMAAGVRGFRRGAAAEALSLPPLHESGWSWSDAADGHYGGHFGCISRRFISRRVAPLLRMP